MIVRLRLADGSMEKIQLDKEQLDSITLKDVLMPFEVPEDATIKVGNQRVIVTTKKNDGNASSLSSSTTSTSNLKELGIQHGSMITIHSTQMLEKALSSCTESDVSRLSKMKKKDAASSSMITWNPYPDLAKDYQHALLKIKTKRSTQKGMTYDDISRLRSSLHVIEPQEEGTLQRVYICRRSADRFHNNGIVVRNKNGNIKSEEDAEYSCRVGLLLGTIQKERVDNHLPKKSRTSLSSTTSDEDYCTVAKVQAVWEPPNQSPSKDGKLYDAIKAQDLLTKYSRVLCIADQLGLVPVGWIFSYLDDRLQDTSSDGSLNRLKKNNAVGNIIDNDKERQALLGMDVATGALLQGQNMKRLGQLEGNKFVTLAMDASSGSTEAFQLSDVTVQMVHENMLESLVPPAVQLSQENNPRIVTTRHEVLVDGHETKQLECVLCLINTAMLSLVGNFAGKTSTSVVKKSNGSLTNKSKKALLKALEMDDRTFFEEMCDFNVLVALDQYLANDDMEQLCELVKKWSRGQKQGTIMDSKLKLQIKSILSS